MNGTTVVLCGDPSLFRSLMLVKTITRAITKAGGGYLIELHRKGIIGETPEEEKVEDVHCLLEHFGDVFAMPSGLPPPRDHDHAIEMRPGVTPVGVRLYQYPQVHKDEIERLVRDMLEGEIIEPSVSPFSNPVLLFKKKNES